MSATRKTGGHCIMENPCITHFVFIGNKIDIKLLYGKLRYLTKLKTRLYRSEASNTSLRCVAKFFCPEWESYTVDGMLYGLELTNERQIKLTVVSEAAPYPEVWFHLARKYQTVKVYYSATQEQSGQYRTNDAAGRYFPQRYIVVSADGNVKPFVAQNELYEEVAQAIPLAGTFTTLEAFGKAVKSRLKGIRIFDILVVDNRGKCISNNQHLISQWL